MVTWGGGGGTVGWPLNAKYGTSHVIQSVHGDNKEVLSWRVGSGLAHEIWTGAFQEREKIGLQ